MSNYHEDMNELSAEAKNMTRALASLKEEIEAVDWYSQRTDVTDDAALKDILNHNKEEEMEHACMVLEWLRRNMDGWEQHMRTYLFSDGDIVGFEEEKGKDDEARNELKVGIGKLR